MKKTNKVSDKLKREDMPPCKYFLSTGSTLLDLAISDRHPGGVGSGRITHIYGDNSTAKSVLVQEILGSAQAAGGHAIFEDSEETLDFERAEKHFNLSVGKWRNDVVLTKQGEDKLEDAVKVDEQFTYRVPQSIEELFDGEIGPATELIRNGKLKGPVAIGVDTFSALPSIAEQQAELTDATYGTSRAKMYSTAFRKYVHPMASTDLTVVAVDQTREKIGVTWGKKHAVSGGKAIQFYSSTRILLRHLGNILNKHKHVIGVKIGFEIEKNKIAPPFREGYFRLLFDYGIDDLASNLEWLKDNTPEKFDSKLAVAGSWWTWGDMKEQGLEKLILMIETAKLEDEVRDEVVRVWKVTHAPLGRKKRTR